MSLLNSYTEERLPVIAEMLNKTTSLLNETVTASNGADNIKRWQRGTALLMLGVNCRWSSIVVDDQSPCRGEQQHPVMDSYEAQSDGLKAGDRAPDAPGLKDIHGGGTMHLFDVFGVAYHMVLVFSDSPERYTGVLDLLSRFPQGTVRSSLVVRSGTTPVDAPSPTMILEDTRGHAYSAYSFEEKCDIAVVRPDGVLGAVVGGPESLKEYFKKMFL
ncbi:hypothetical protein B0H10DRAFT_2216423 [Mycena sp. CBHHK59/15]|nr:hypothetical protein B0H10DRAFT_2216423 [Mycena sp. CBHHK59/15]